MLKIELNIPGIWLIENNDVYYSKQRSFLSASDGKPRITRTIILSNFSETGHSDTVR